MVMLGCGGVGESRAVKPAVAGAAEGVWVSVLKVDDEGGGIATWISSGGAVVRVELPDGEPRLGRPAVLKWVRNCANAVSAFYGKFPVRRVTVSIAAVPGYGVEGGKEYDGKQIDVRLGKAASVSSLRNDWVLTHEMFHLGFPDLGEKYLWMNEGLSDYLEPVARARAGELTVEQVWKEWVEGFPEGLPALGDKGLDYTHTWGRTYWGGTFFWLMADIRIRERTGGRHALDDAIKAILNAGGDGSRMWTIEKVIDVGDRATGTQVIRELHEEMGVKSAAMDLPGLWKRLGVRYARGRVTFDDSAPWAGIRKAITASH